MNTLKKNSIQFDYFNENYQQFEEDFYKYSSLNIPLTFLTDDILHLMSTSGKNFFRLNALNAKDNRDHFFYFKLNNPADNPNIKMYEYAGLKEREIFSSTDNNSKNN